jgi:hypothetical protein
MKSRRENPLRSDLFSVRHALSIETSSSTVGRLAKNNQEDSSMGRGILLWLLGVPIPVIIILALLWH